MRKPIVLTILLCFIYSLSGAQNDSGFSLGIKGGLSFYRPEGSSKLRTVPAAGVELTKDWNVSDWIFGAGVACEYVMRRNKDIVYVPVFARVGYRLSDRIGAVANVGYKRDTFFAEPQLFYQVASGLKLSFGVDIYNRVTKHETFITGPEPGDKTPVTHTYKEARCALTLRFTYDF